MKRQSTIRMSDATRAKADALAQRYGTITEVIAVAIDRMYESEMPVYEMRILVPGEMFEVYKNGQFFGSLRRFPSSEQPYAGLSWYYSGNGNWYASLEDAKAMLGL